MAGIRIRAGHAEDLERIAEIEAASPGAARWAIGDYLAYDLLVAVCENRVVGFAIMRTVAPGESELLNLAVDVEWRRRGVGRALLQDALVQHPGDVFLEVRESNAPARKFYQALGFQEVGVRSGYYSDPPERGIVMKIHSC